MPKQIPKWSNEWQKYSYKQTLIWSCYLLSSWFSWEENNRFKHAWYIIKINECLMQQQSRCSCLCQNCRLLNIWMHVVFEHIFLNNYNVYRCKEIDRPAAVPITKEIFFQLMVGSLTASRTIFRTKCNLYNVKLFLLFTAVQTFHFCQVGWWQLCCSSFTKADQEKTMSFVESYFTEWLIEIKSQTSQRLACNYCRAVEFSYQRSQVCQETEWMLCFSW